MFEPFAVQLYRRYLSGESVEELSAELGIPEDRIVRRLEVAEAYLARKDSLAA